MEGILGGIVGIVVLILAICIAVSWLVFPIWIYTINESLKDIRQLMIRREGEKK